jgi:hypothetical protein
VGLESIPTTESWLIEPQGVTGQLAPAAWNEQGILNLCPPGTTSLLVLHQNHWTAVVKSPISQDWYHVDSMQVSRNISHKKLSSHTWPEGSYAILLQVNGLTHNLTVEPPPVNTRQYISNPLEARPAHGPDLTLSNIAIRYIPKYIPRNNTRARRLRPLDPQPHSEPVEIIELDTDPTPKITANTNRKEGLKAVKPPWSNNTGKETSSKTNHKLQ